MRSEIEASWHPRTWQRGKWAQVADRDMRAHLATHSFAEVLRFEIRQDLEEVPDEQRPTIVRDIYRSLLGSTTRGRFTLMDPDAVGVYSIDEALGDVAMYQFWRSANNCGLHGCRH
ncbi:MAG TPA: hypothetical protein VKV73_27305 [Chloroflexota bacterium]|nr:hypothetical protein [Chloroflexota bacterium]